MTGTTAGAIKRLEKMREEGTDNFAEYGAKGGAKGRGRKLSKKTKLKISRVKRSKGKQWRREQMAKGKPTKKPDTYRRDGLTNHERLLKQRKEQNA